jgi:hypothetical protein
MEIFGTPPKKQEEKLDKSDIQAVLTELDRNPSATNKQLAQLVDDKEYI